MLASRNSKHHEFAVLPSDVWSTIVRYLDNADRLYLSGTSHHLREICATGGLRELSLYKLDVDKVALQLDRPWIRKLLNNTERLVVNLPRGRFENALRMVRLMQPEVLQISCDLLGVGHLDALLAECGLQRLRKLAVWDIMRLTQPWIELVHRCAATLQSINVATFDELQTTLSNDQSFPSLNALKHFTLQAIASADCETHLRRLLRYSPLEKLSVPDLSFNSVRQILQHHSSTLVELSVDIWYAEYARLTPRLRMLDCNELSAEYTVLPNTLQSLKTCIAQRDTRDLDSLTRWVADRMWCPGLISLTVYPHRSFHLDRAHEQQVAASRLFGCMQASSYPAELVGWHPSV